MLDTATTLTLPTARLGDIKSTIELMPVDKEFLHQLKIKAYQLTQKNFENALFRKLHRKYQLSVLMQREISVTLSSRCKTHTFYLGVANLETDDTLLNFDMSPGSKATQRFCYKQKNLCLLDTILGDAWDFNVVDGLTSFVTSVTVRLKDSVLSVVVATATYHGLCTVGNHRAVLEKHMNGLKPGEAEKDGELS